MRFAARSNQQTAWQQSQYPQSQQGYQQGPMGGYGGMMGPGIAQGTVSTGQSVTIQQAVQMMRNIPAYAKVISGNNTVVFDSNDFSVVVLALMPDEAVNLTGTQPPSYATDDVFVIYGLINPTIVVRAGASVQFTVVNLDDDMYHNLVVSSYGPPYAYMSMQGMMSSNWMPYLPPADYAQGSAHEYSYTMNMNQPGTFWYLCTYEGHAQSGMYGQLIVIG
jgi:rusticyanin